MNLSPDDYIPITEKNTSKFLDFHSLSGFTLITSYALLNKKINVDQGSANDDNTLISLSDKKPSIIKDINSLKGTLRGVISIAESLLEVYAVNLFMPEQFHRLAGLNIDLLINQLIFDILVDKYESECELTTRYGYANSHIIECLENNSSVTAKSIDAGLHRGMENYYKRMNRPDFQEQLMRLGNDLEKFNKYYDPNMKENSDSKKPIFVWDRYFFNSSLHVAGRQYRRQFTKKNGNYEYETAFSDLKSYNTFVEKLLPPHNESPQKYFMRSMRYYLLESYKRIDFMFKLISAMPKMGIDKIDREHFLIKRFVPNVLVLAEENGELLFRIDSKYYRPLFVIEDDIQKQIQDDPNPHYQRYEQLLNRYQYARAKSYELFNYHFKFESNDCVEIKRFLIDSYDMQSYHNSTEVWKRISGNEWESLKGEEKKQVRKLMRECMSINNEAFFWPLSDIEPSQE